MISWNEFKILVQHKKNYKKIEQANKVNAIASLLKWNLQLGKEPYKTGFPVHPMQRSLVEASKETIREFAAYRKPGVPTTLGFGDSILAFTKHDITNVIHPDLNFALPGAASSNFRWVMEQLYPTLQQHGLADPQHIVLGTFGGNALLSGQDYEVIKMEARECFQAFRANFKFAKLIVYGIPPVFDVYATHYAADFNRYLISLVTLDRNACYVDLYARFAGPLSLWPALKLLPTPNFSGDGVHLTGKGIIEFGKALEKAKEPGRMLV